VKREAEEGTKTNGDMAHDRRPFLVRHKGRTKHTFCVVGSPKLEAPTRPERCFSFKQLFGEGRPASLARQHRARYAAGGGGGGLGGLGGGGFGGLGCSMGQPISGYGRLAAA
jgi:hypothetical protein